MEIKLKTSIIAFLFLCSFPRISSAKELSHQEITKLFFFHSPNCHACLKVKTEFMPGFEAKFKNKIAVEYKDINDIENYKLLVSLKEQYGQAGRKIIPMIFVKGYFLYGQKGITLGLEKLADYVLKGPASGENKHPVIIDLISRFLSFSPLAIIGAGLLDGINPCAFAVIIFFISFLALQGYRRKELLVIGLFFVFAVFTAYLLIGVGLFSFMYSLKGFWHITKVINMSVGIFCFLLGLAALYDFFQYKLTGKTEGLVLQLPQKLKNRIHTIIGAIYRKSKDKDNQRTKGQIVRLAFSAFITGFLISILEAVCTGQVYLPTITFVLKTSHFKLQAFCYLLLYNFMFILPLLSVFIVALLGVSSEQLSAVFKKHFLSVKLAMAILFFSFAVYLFWRA